MKLRWMASLAAVLSPVAWFAGAPATPAFAVADPTATHMYLEPVSGSVRNGQVIDVSIYVDVGVADPLSLANGVVDYPPGLLQCESISGTGSAFDSVFTFPFVACDDSGPDDGRVGVYATVSGANRVVGQHQLLGTIRFRADATNDGLASLELFFTGSPDANDSSAFTYRPVTNQTEEVLDSVAGAEIRTK